MTKSELVTALSQKLRQISRAEVEVIVEAIFDKIQSSLVELNRVELRGFGIFEIRHRRARQGRNPKSGNSVDVKDRYVPFFKVGKELRDRLNQEEATSSARTIEAAEISKSIGA